jgi:hypothetical protein
LIAPGATEENQLAARIMADFQRTALAGQGFCMFKADIITGRRIVIEVPATTENKELT